MFFFSFLLHFHLSTSFFHLLLLFRLLHPPLFIYFVVGDRLFLFPTHLYSFLIYPTIAVKFCYAVLVVWSSVACIVCEIFQSPLLRYMLRHAHAYFVRLKRFKRNIERATERQRARGMKLEKNKRYM